MLLTRETETCESRECEASRAVTKENPVLGVGVGRRLRLSLATELVQDQHGIYETLSIKKTRKYTK